ncbi:growth arrest and DNA damage-inducible proteins-interacting protein 1 isoform X2 [Teleopsis dalmanni]|nr:growth arrest and DNA damage-inducible proteins-interacting protein 1 isoform X2 [Teleopsis dalmanni]
MVFGSYKNTFATKAKSLNDENEEPEQPPSFMEEIVEIPVNPKKFNKSRLLAQHRNMLNEKIPYQEPQSWIHLSEKYQRKIFGKYGSQSGIDPRICFNTKEDLAAKNKYEKAAHPYTLQQMIAKVNEEKLAKTEKIQKREDEIAKKLVKLDQWKKELNAKIAKKEAEMQAAKDRKERLIEEVRRHFGFKLDPRDDRFKEMLEQKEKEDKKKQKEARRKSKEDQMVAKLLQKSEQ